MHAAGLAIGPAIGPAIVPAIVAAKALSGGSARSACRPVSGVEVVGDIGGPRTQITRVWNMNWSTDATNITGL